MKIYTKHGDGGMTTLMSATQISKADERINALGVIDELTSQMGLAKAYIASMNTAESTTCVAHFDRVQSALMTIMAGIADPRNRKHTVSEEETAFLEYIIDAVEASFPREHKFILPGSCELSARLDVARTVARRAERTIAVMDRKYAASPAAKAYLNRLSDYLYMLARKADYDEAARREGKAAPAAAAATAASPVDSIVEEVLRRVADARPLDLDKATRLIAEVEKCAKAMGKQAVIAVCNSEGNPIAVHVMDGAFLVSYDVAIKKAYTAVSVKMPTKDLYDLVQPGQTFYGLQNVDKMVCFGGGVPLKIGDTIVGGLGISGGTGEEDHALCECGIRAFATL
ncbi:MAG: cob(I)yrinic acid a,c-diamide adenosyltransferase [Clostridia bacterium]|jgi:ATP:cob(I)alamin adenosyltransferase|nr:cob(I)yrinic acid a,c-diamide adenosyltransferase [Clostridia bacterium]